MRGDVEVWYKDFDGMAKKVLSPYGDGTSIAGIRGFNGRFSPPYGDGTTMLNLMKKKTAFSPPYGDGTKSIRSIIKFAGVFAPLRGWY